MLVAWVADAAIGNLQEKAMKNHGATSREVMCLSFALGSALILGIMVSTGELSGSATVLLNVRKILIFFIRIIFCSLLLLEYLSLKFIMWA